jgi:TPR repeat protein
MGLMYYYGKGVSVNYKKAMSLFEKAIYGKSTINKKVPFVYLETHLHDDDAQDTLVFCTVTYWKLKGEPFYYLGMMHKNGHGVRPDEEKAQGYFSEALYHRCKRAKHEIRE